MICGSLNIQHQSTGIGPLPLLVKIELRLRQTVQGLFSYSMALSNGRAWEEKKLEIPRKITGVLYKRAKSWQINKIQAHS